MCCHYGPEALNGEGPRPWPAWSWSHLPVGGGGELVGALDDAGCSIEHQEGVVTDLELDHCERDAGGEQRRAAVLTGRQLPRFFRDGNTRARVKQQLIDFKTVISRGYAAAQLVLWAVSLAVHRMGLAFAGRVIPMAQSDNARADRRSSCRTITMTIWNPGNTHKGARSLTAVIVQGRFRWRPPSRLTPGPLGHSTPELTHALQLSASRHGGICNTCEPQRGFIIYAAW